MTQHQCPADSCCLSSSPLWPSSPSVVCSSPRIFFRAATAPLIRSAFGKQAFCCLFHDGKRSSLFCTNFSFVLIVLFAGHMLIDVPLQKRRSRKMRAMVAGARARPVLSPVIASPAAPRSHGVFSTTGGARTSFRVSSKCSRAAARSGYATAAAAAASDAGSTDPFGGRPDPFANRPPPIANKRPTPKEKVETYIRDDFHLKPLEVVTNEVR